MAYNVRTGETLWKFQTGWGISAPPMTYEVDGVQYVAVAAGGNRGGITTLDGDAVWAFALNGTMDEVASPGPIQTKVATPGGNTSDRRRGRRPDDPGRDVGLRRHRPHPRLPLRPARCADPRRGPP